MKVLIIAGGTGGHIFPGLAVAETLTTLGVDVHWLGTRQGLEAQLVEGQYPISYVAFKGIRGKGLFTKLLSPIRLVQAVYQSWKIIKKIKPDVVLGLGGYVAAPGGIAARLAKIPLVIHEQNAIAGYTNRLLARLSQTTLSGFPDAFPEKVKATMVGNPIRSSIRTLDNPEQRFSERQGKLRILVLGGSRGARSVNDLVLSVLREFTQREGLTLWHQAGSLDYERIQAGYRDIEVEHKVESFINDMPSAYAWADCVICRSGALTVAELAAVGLGSVLIPYPFAVDDHQFFNGKYLQQAGAAYLIPQQDLTAEKLSELLYLFVEDRDIVCHMAVAARKLAYPSADAEVADACMRLM